MPKIATFVFFDIETTGFPWQERNQTKITELSFVASLRKDLEIASYGSVPLILSKLTLVLNPQRPIHQEVVKLTGLSNDLVRNAPTFRQKVKCITSFLEDLPKPTCLVAHNGNIFDFKILLAECCDANASLPADLLCVDSLLGFRQLLKGTNLNFHNIPTQIPLNIDNDILTDDEDEEWPNLNVSTEEWQEIDDICQSLSDMSCEELPVINDQGKKKIKKKRSEAIKNVFKKSAAKESFTLTDLYKRLLNKEQNDAHRAEVDCIMLAECVVAIKDCFLTWADDKSKLLTEISPLSRNYVSKPNRQWYSKNENKV